MGVGFPEDLVVCVCLGVDMFDCVYPSRTARFGTAFSDEGPLKLKLAKFKFDFRKINEGCDCEACTLYTRSFFNTVAGKEEVAAQLITKHNIRYLLLLMERMRTAIKE
jgi:tRNA-guanine family transglycosylase